MDAEVTILFCDNDKNLKKHDRKIKNKKNNKIKKKQWEGNGAKKKIIIIIIIIILYKNIYNIAMIIIVIE